MVIFLAPLVSLGLAATSSAPVETGCTRARDFIATLEYLRSTKELAMQEPEARVLAMKTADAACSGSGRRLIRVSQLLLKSGLSARDSLQAGLEFAGRGDRETETFIGVFRAAFQGEHLDLDLGSAMKLARSLSTEFDGDVLRVMNDFEHVAEYCVGAKGLELPKPTCAELAARVAKRGETLGGGVADDFVRILEFARSKDGPHMTTAAALKTAEELVGAGPGAADNFVTGYRFAVREKGLAMPVEEAVRWASGLALKTATKAPGQKPSATR